MNPVDCEYDNECPEGFMCFICKHNKRNMWK